MTLSQISSDFYGKPRVPSHSTGYQPHCELRTSTSWGCSPHARPYSLVDRNSSLPLQVAAPTRTTPRFLNNFGETWTPSLPFLHERRGTEDGPLDLDASEAIGVFFSLLVDGFLKWLGIGEFSFFEFVLRLREECIFWGLLLVSHDNYYD